MSFTDRVVIVTGASSGIGAAIALKFAEEQANVVLVARNQTKLSEVAVRCQKFGAKTIMVIADVIKDDDVKKIVSKTIEEFKKIDILINNAGMIGKTAIWDGNAMELYDKIMSTNLRSVVHLTNLAAPHLIQSKGNIINISSIASVDVVLSQYFAYCTSKAGLDHFMRSIALDFAAKGVRVNNVNPGPVKTDIIQYFGVAKADFERVWKMAEETTTLGRISDPSEIGDLVLFLASDKARAITGSAFIIDNGALLKKKIMQFN